METPGHLGASVWGHSSAAVLTGFLAPGASAPQRPPSAPPPQHPQWPGAPSAPLLGTPPGPPCAVPGAPVGTDRGLHGQNDGNGFSQGLEAGVHSPGVHQADLSCSPRKPPCCAASLVSAGPRQPPVSSAPSRAAAASGSVCSGLPSARVFGRELPLLPGHQPLRRGPRPSNMASVHWGSSAQTLRPSTVATARPGGWNLSLWGRHRSVRHVILWCFAQSQHAYKFAFPCLKNLKTACDGRGSDLGSSCEQLGHLSTPHVRGGPSGLPAVGGARACGRLPVLPVLPSRCLRACMCVRACVCVSGQLKQTGSETRASSG